MVLTGRTTFGGTGQISLPCSLNHSCSDGHSWHRHINSSRQRSEITCGDVRWQIKMFFSRVMEKSLFIFAWMLSLGSAQVLSNDQPGIDSQLEPRQALLGSPFLNPILASAFNPLRLGVPGSLPLQQQLLPYGLGLGGLSNLGDRNGLQALAELQGLPDLQGLQDPQSSLLKRIGPFGLPNRLGTGLINPRALGLGSLLPGLRGGLGGRDSVRDLLGYYLNADGNDGRGLSNSLQFSDRNQLQPQSGFTPTYTGESNRNENQELNEFLASLQRAPQNGLGGPLAPAFGLRRLPTALPANPFLGGGSRFLPTIPIQRKGLEFDSEHDTADDIGSFDRGFGNLNSRQQDVNTDGDGYFIFPN
ncbi:uncharacterized protein LOC135223628 [Macrobrachium nipponense]|uniref:uncharacterized protein LOC135223628 n=1 Tax=Macrobrachium nipponense TaxID=159736 RepID=UPI0030C87DD7